MIKTQKIKVRVLAVLLMIALVCGLLLSGCGEQETETNAGANVSEANVEMTTFTDDCDRTVEVPAQIETVVASGNLAQIFIYAIAPDTLMAISGGWTDDAQEYVDEAYLSLPEVVRPLESAAFQTFVVKTEAFRIPVKYLDLIFCPVDEHEHRFFIKIQIEVVLDDRRKPVDRLAHIHMFR